MFILCIIDNNYLKYKKMKIPLNLNVDNKCALYFLLPSITGCLIFIFLPSIASFMLSFCDWNLIGRIKFVGLNNYLELFSTYEFWFVFKNTIIYALTVTIWGTIIPLILASVLNSKIRFKDFYKTAYFLPFITPMVVIAMIWQWIFDPNIGAVNVLLKTHLEWLFDSNLALGVLIFISVWKLIGYNMIIYLSGFAAISNDIYEAAKIDGAGKIKTFFKITVPMLSPTIFFVIVITTITSFQVFDLIYLMTEGGPDNSTNVLVYYVFNNAFELFEIGKASSAAYILFLFIFVLTILQWKLRKKWVERE